MGKIWTADELMAMTPERRQELFDANSTGDINEMPEHLVEMARKDIQAHIDTTEARFCTLARRPTRRPASLDFDA